MGRRGKAATVRAVAELDRAEIEGITSPSAEKGKIAAASPGSQAPPNPAQIGLTLGAAAWLMTQSSADRGLYISDLDWLVLPPVMLGQTRIYHKNETPLAYVSWALVSEEVERRLASGNVRMSDHEWKSGDRPWLIHLIAPAALRDRIVEEVTGTVFGGVQPKIVGG